MADVKVSGIPPDTGLDDNHYVILNDPVGPTTKTTTLGVLRAWLQSVVSWVKSSMVDYSTMAFNLKVSYNSSLITPVSGVSQNNSGQGLAITTTVSTACKALVDVGLCISSTADFEFHPIVFLDGVEVARLSPVAAPGFAGNRGTMRTAKAVVSLTAGAHTISGGNFVSSGAGLACPTLGAVMSAVILGNATA